MSKCVSKNKTNHKTAFYRKYGIVKTKDLSFKKNSIDESLNLNAI